MHLGGVDPNLIPDFRVNKVRTRKRPRFACPRSLSKLVGVFAPLNEPADSSKQPDVTSLDCIR
jgi:hypothetical protein